jgi:hypothetical protein
MTAETGVFCSALTGSLKVLRMTIGRLELKPARAGSTSV